MQTRARGPPAPTTWPGLPAHAPSWIRPWSIGPPHAKLSRVPGKPTRWPVRVVRTRTAHTVDPDSPARALLHEYHTATPTFQRPGPGSASQLSGSGARSPEPNTASARFFVGKVSTTE